MPGNPLQISIADLNEVLQTYTSIRIYKASTQAGSYSLLDTITLVAGDTAYDYNDDAGVATDWYRYSFFHSISLDESNLSDPAPAGGVTLYTRQYLRRSVAHRLSLYGWPRTNYTHPGPSGTTTSAGDTSSVIASAFISTRVPARWFEGWFCLLNGGSAAGEEREIASFDPTTGDFTVSPIYSAASGSGTTFDLYGEAPSSWWNERLEWARKHIWVPFRFPIAGVTNQREYALPDFISRDVQIERLVRQTGTTIREHGFTPGYGIDLIQQDGGGLSLYIPNGLSENAVWYLEGKRNPPEFLSDTSTLALSDELLDLLIITGCQNACQVLADALFGNTEDRRIWADKAARFEVERRGIVTDLGMFETQRPARRRPMVASGGGRYDLSGY